VSDNRPSVADGKGRRKLRWSLPTRIFLAFALIIVCTGASSLYAIATVAALRHELTFLRARALPLLDELRQATAELRAFDEALQRAAPQDLDWVVRLLPNARPYQRVDQLLAHARQMALLADPPRLAQLVSRRAPPLPLLDAELAKVRSGNQAQTQLVRDREMLALLGDLVDAHSDAQAYDAITAALQKSTAERRVSDSARLVVELRRMIRHVQGGLERAQLAFERGLTARFEDAERAENNLVLVVVLASGLALAMAVLMLLVSVVALRPLAALTEVVRRFASGERKVRAVSRGPAEIATLAEEWNGMADALAEREKQLSSQRDELQRAERLGALGQIAARMAHEVRNPLSSIGLNAELLDEELLRDGPLDRHEARELLASIGAEIERLRILTDGYLDRGRVTPAEQVALDPAVLVRSLVEFVAPELELRKVQIELQLQPGLEVEGDASSLRQALWNLVRNGCEAAAEGGRLWIEVGLQQAELGDRLVMVAIEDSGSGVAPAIRERIFEPFVTNKERGTGIGLAVVREIVRQHRGRVELQPGHHGPGARFVMLFPQRQACG
jgi:signal transduction histidine kinase